MRRLTLILALMPCSSFAGQTSFECTVASAAEVSDAGRLDSDGDFSAMMLGSSFSVDRASGLVLGAPGGNSSVETRKVVYTPPNNGFHVISESHGPNKHVDLLYVKDYAPEDAKPFVLVTGGRVFTGLCR